MKSKVSQLSKDLEYQYLMDSLNASVSKHLLDEHFTVVAANEYYYRLFGYTKEEYEALFYNRPDLFYKDDQEDWNALKRIVLDTIASGKDRYEFICRMRHKNGKKVWIKLIGIFIDEYIDGVQISYSIMMDISDLMQTKIEKNVTQNNFPGLIAKYYVKEKDLQFIDGNPRFYKCFSNKLSYTKEELKEHIGLHSILENYDVLRKGEQIEFTIYVDQKDNVQQFFKVNAQCFDWEGNNPLYLMTYTDITELIEQKTQLEEYNFNLHKLAYSDDVTSGFNRRKFNTLADKSIKQHPANTYVLLWMNMQQFKLINDIGGIERGDQTLVYVHRKIMHHLHDEEYVARFFSDNFIILMNKKKYGDLNERLNSLLEDINSFNTKTNYKYYLTFKAGLYDVVDAEETIIHMEDNAHAAIDSVRGKEISYCICYQYSDEVKSKMIYNKMLENKMRDALKENEFEVYLQPKYDVKTRRIVSAEALVRWNHSDYGLLSPAKFIPLFENNGFIKQLDHFVFEKVCILLNQWKKEGRELIEISVNMSRVHFDNNDFIDRYIELCNQYQIEKKYIEIELTETMVFENLDTFIKIIQTIHEAGFSCSMDDFGSGYSNLSTLKNLEVDTIKIDKAFFASADMSDEKENTIIKSVLCMAKALHMKTVAEGVETLEQLQFLSATECDLIQGYVFHKPIPIREFVKLIDEQD